MKTYKILLLGLSISSLGLSSAIAKPDCQAVTINNSGYNLLVDVKGGDSDCGINVAYYSPENKHEIIQVKPGNIVHVSVYFCKPPGEGPDFSCIARSPYRLTKKLFTKVIADKPITITCAPTKEWPNLPQCSAE